MATITDALGKIIYQDIEKVEVKKEEQKIYNHEYEIPLEIFLKSLHANKNGKLLIQFSIEAERVNFCFEGEQNLEKTTKKNIFLKIEDTKKNREIVKNYSGKIKEIEESTYIYYVREHKRIVLKAIQEGKTVPEEVLKDYLEV